MAKIPGVYKDKKTGKWYYSISLGFDAITGKRIRKLERGFQSQREANEAKTTALKEAQDMGQISNRGINYKTFMEELFIPEYKSKVQSTTFEARTPILNKLIKQFGMKDIENISNIDIQMWKNSLTENYSQNYARLVYGIFSQTLKKAVGLGIIKNNRAKQVGAVAKEKPNVQFWTKSEFEKVLTTFDLNDFYEHFCFVLVWLYFMTGLRVNEATALRWKEEVNLDKGTITVNHSLRIKNKENWVLGPTKTHAALRTIAIDSDTVSLLKEWKERQNQIDDMQFVLSYDGTPTLKSTISRIIKRHAKLAEIKPIQAKGLRHSHASFLINEYNVNPLIIKDRLGHEDIKTTLSYYSHLYPNTNFEVANNMSGSINISPSSKKVNKFRGNQAVKYSTKK